MKSNEETEKLFKNLRFSPGTSASERILENTETALKQRIDKTKSNRSTPNVWRIIMKNRMTKLAVAAVIIIAVTIGFNIFVGTGTSVAFAEVRATLSAQPWIHMTWQYTDSAIEQSNVMKKVAESWLSVKPHRLFTIYKDGTVSFVEHNEITRRISSQNYNPQTNIITSIYRDMGKENDPPATIADAIFDDLEELEDKGANVKYIDSFRDDEPIKIINFDYTDGDGVHDQFSLVVNAETYLPISMTSISEKSGEKTTANIIFDYPEAGPIDIYQVQVPHDTRIKVIDYRPSPELLEAIKPYRTARNNLPKQRITVEVRKENDAYSLVSIEYTNDGKGRIEQLKCQNNNPPVETDDLETILAWASGVKEGELRIQLNDGTTVYCANRDYFGRWTNKTIPALNYKVGFVSSGLIHHGWPKIDLGRPIQNKYASEKNLLCIETISEPSFADTKLAESAEKTLYYLDPEHDYICIHTESFRRPAPPTWGNQKVSDSEVNFDPYDIPSEPYLITDVVELIQTGTGHWYPKRIMVINKQAWFDKGNGWNMRKNTVDVKLYVNFKPVFPDTIFDPESLPHIDK